MAIQFLNTVQVDTSVLYVDTANDKVGIGTTSPSSILDVSFGASASNTAQINLNGASGAAAELVLRAGGDDNGTIYNRRAAIRYYSNQISTTTAQWVNGVSMTQTTGDDKFYFNNSGNSTVLCLQQNGRVGIGTVSPGVKLEVDTNSTFAGAAQFGNSTGNRLYILNDDGGNRIQLDAISSGGASNLIFSNGGSESMRIASTGNVGIGTTSPGAKLHINTGATYEVGSLSGSMLIEPTGVAFNGYGAGIVLGAGRGGRASGGAAIASVLDSASDVDRSGLSFFYHNSTFSDPRTEGMRLNADGNVGIGTVSPSKKLEVVSNTTYDGIQIKGSSIPTLGIIDTTNNAKFIAYVRDSDATIGMETNHPLTINTNNTERMRIDASGNVGIGTTNPSGTPYRLTIGDGDIYAQQAVAKITLGQFGSQGDAHFGASGIGSPTVGSQDYGFYSAHNAYRTSTGAWKHSRTSTIPSVRLLGSGGVSSGNQGFSFDYSANVGTADITWTNLMQILPSGNVGIGTTSPNYNLVVGDGTTDTESRFYHSDASYTSVRGFGLYMSRGISYIRPVNDGSQTLHIGSAANTWGTFSADANIFTLNRDGASRLYINSTGNVGIGTTSPNVLGFLETGLNIAAGSSSSTTLQQAGLVISGSSDSDDADDFGYLSFTNYQSTLSSNRVAEIRINKGGSNVNTGKFNFYTANGTALNESMVLGETGLLKLSQYGAGTLVSDASGNITATATPPGTGTFLPLAGGTMTGVAGVVFPDAFKLNLGTGSDLQILHDGFDSYINNINSSLNIRNSQNDGDIYFQSDNGSGGIATYFYLDGSLVNGTSIKGATRFPDSSKIYMGDSGDMELFHSGTTATVSNATGDLQFLNYANDTKIRFYNDDGAGGIIEYIRIDGSSVETVFSKDARWTDGIKAKFGNSSDLQIYHDGSNSYIKDNGIGDLRFMASNIKFYDNATAELMAQMIPNGAVELYYNNSKKFETTNAGVSVTGDIQIDSALLSNQENTDIDSAAAEVVAQVSTTYTAAFFDFVVKKTTNVRSGTVYACHDGTNIEFTETSTNDLGDTSDVTLSVDISGTNMRLLATVTSDDWSVKSLIRAI